MNKATGIYIHFPFCVKKCNYCAFLSFNADESVRREYANALMKEIELAGRSFSGQISTVYLGGGTPSVMDVALLSLIMKKIRSCFDVKPDAEITIEANPATLGIKDRVVRAKLTAYKYMGINRLSMGVQSMDNNRLTFLGRIHTAENVERDFAIAREMGFDNINLDLIFSVPGESTSDALADARRIIDLGPEHISCYSLQLEEGTPFYRMAEAGEIREISDEEDRKTYHEVVRLLRAAGYEHYEISNFARDGKRSRHNSLYWNMSDYIGLGLGASGFVNGTRYRNLTDLDEYMKAVSEEKLPVMEEHVNSAFDNISEAVFTGLRRIEGISYSDAVSVYRASDGAEDIKGNDEEVFWTIFKDAREEAEKFSEQGLLIIDGEGLRLTSEGIDISNTIMSCFV
ncbi:MAG: radical SAM family heme chaperone HemW [Mogibacterium sp.]|nr:radical SAM family heme chaperone HemW [Mogibacterium sp.]MBR2539353.1 radical SAM family heme chaperone HemW [Mogibacterium sp.]